MAFWVLFFNCVLQIHYFHALILLICTYNAHKSQKIAIFHYKHE
jgi:hypothetical protein